MKKETAPKKKKAIILTVGLIVAALAIVGALFVYSGIYNVAASKWHPAIEGKFFSTVMVQSVRHQARNIPIPADIDLHDRTLAGKFGGAYGKACQTCHGGPGVKPDPWVYLYPPATDLTDAAVVDRWSDAELYWIIKNGIEHTGMIALGPTHGDEELWSVSAFVRQLPTMSPADYKAMVNEYARADKAEE